LSDGLLAAPAALVETPLYSVSAADVPPEIPAPVIFLRGFALRRRFAAQYFLIGLFS